MPWYSAKYTFEYDRTRTALGQQGFATAFASLGVSLSKAMGTAGFEASGAASLDQLRAFLSTPRPGDPPSASEATRLLDAVGATPALSASERQRAAAVKMLRHTYLVRQRGGQSTWMLSLPDDFTQWPEAALGAATADAAKDLLGSSNEHFSGVDLQNLSDGMQDALRWCQKAMFVLGQLQGSGQGKADAMALVRRWFAEPATTDTEAAAAGATLLRGFKTIAGALNRNQVILTDFVPLRGAAPGSDEEGYLDSEAFVFALSGRERLDVVYIERDFFRPGGTVAGKGNWSRILVHEMSHLVVGTADVPAGADSRYAWYGIAPNPNFTAAEALTNADNWAFFAADCAGALSPGERTAALRVR